MAAPKQSRNGRRPGRQASLEARIQDCYASLPASERKLADLILDFPGDIAAYSATELAALSGGSKSAASRLFRRLGFRNYGEARRSARDAQRWGSPLYLDSKRAAVGSLAKLIEHHVGHEQDLLARTFERLEPEQLEAIVDRLIESRRVVLLGYRNSHYVASFARWQLLQVRGNVDLIPQSGETLGEYMVGLGSQDLLVAVGLRRRVVVLAEAMAAARAAGSKILYVTDLTAGESADLADWTLRCEVRSDFLFDSYAPVMSLLNLLFSVVARRSGRAGRARLKEIERLHESLREFGLDRE